MQLAVPWMTASALVGLQVNAYDLVAALDMLAQLESEQTGQRKQYLQVCL